MCGSSLRGFDAEIVSAEPLCLEGRWIITNLYGTRLAVRQYIISDADLAASGLSVGAYIKARYSVTVNSVTGTVPDYNIMYSGNSCVENGSGNFPTGSKYLGWEKPCPGKGPGAIRIEFIWESGTRRWSFLHNNGNTYYGDVNNDAPHSGLIPEGHGIYIAFAASADTAITIPAVLVSCPGPSSPPISPPSPPAPPLPPPLPPRSPPPPATLCTSPEKGNAMNGRRECFCPDGSQYPGGHQAGLPENTCPVTVVLHDPTNDWEDNIGGAVNEQSCNQWCQRFGQLGKLLRAT